MEVQVDIFFSPHAALHSFLPICRTLGILRKDSPERNPLFKLNPAPPPPTLDKNNSSCNTWQNFKFLEQLNNPPHTVIMRIE